MPTTSPATDYLTELQMLLAPAAMRSTSVRAHDFLPKSKRMRQTLASELTQTKDETALNLLEIQLLAAAAADMAIVGKLAPAARKQMLRDRSADALILQALKDPAAFLNSDMRMVRYRGADRDLLAAIHQTLTSIQDATIETTADAITAALSLNASVLRDAAKLAGMDTEKLLKELGGEEIASFAVEAWEKISLLVGDENADAIMETVGESLEKLREKTAVTTYVKRILETDILYRETRALVQAYEGPAQKMARLTPKVIALEGSFAGRNKLVATLIRLLSLAKLTHVLRTPPWGPLLTASGYLLLIGYEIYSAHDHIASTPIPILDRVTGVRTLVQKALAADEAATNK